MDLNSGTIIGRLTRDAELKYIGQGTPLASFSIACNDRRKQGDQWVDEANFFDVNLWGKAAESLSQYLVKGKQVALEYKLKQERWEQDGKSRSRVILVALSCQLLGGGQQQGQGGGSAAAAGAYSDAADRAPPGGANDDIPF